MIHIRWTAQCKKSILILITPLPLNQIVSKCQGSQLGVFQFGLIRYQYRSIRILHELTMSPVYCCWDYQVLSLEMWSSAVLTVANSQWSAAWQPQDALQWGWCNSVAVNGVFITQYIFKYCLLFSCIYMINVICITIIFWRL